MTEAHYAGTATASVGSEGPSDSSRGSHLGKKWWLTFLVSKGKGDERRSLLGPELTPGRFSVLCLSS